MGIIEFNTLKSGKILSVNLINFRGNVIGKLIFKELVQLLSHVRLFATPWAAAHQASLSINSSQSLLKLISIESVMPS